MGVKADLHIHTTFSDGFDPPYELLKKCSRNNLSIISITDHDSVAAFPEITFQAKEFGIEVIPGVELSVTVADKDVHVLGYFVDYTSRKLQEYLAIFRHERLKRAKCIVEKLNDHKIPLTFESVVRRAGDAAVGRPHIALALVEEGFTQTYQEAFYKYIGNGGPAYEKKFQLTPSDAVQLISESDGLSFLAHPGRTMTDDTLQLLIKAGLDGIEVIHPSHSPELITHYRGVVSEYFLLESGGSDYHGGKRNDEVALGSYWIDDALVENMKRRLFSYKSAEE